MNNQTPGYLSEGPTSTKPLAEGDQRQSLSTVKAPGFPASGDPERCDAISPIGSRSASLEEIRQAAKIVACPFTRMNPPTVEGARVVVELLRRMAAGDMEAAEEFWELVAGPSPWEELRG